jgi:hypothetical protein
LFGLYFSFVTLSAFVVLILLVVVGLGWPIARRLRLLPAEQVLASVALAVTGVWLVGWLIYVANLPADTAWVLPLLAVAGLWEGRTSFQALWASGEVRSLLVGQLLVTAWALGLLLLITSYSGGGWAGDWLEHLDRAQFFAGHGDRQQLFLGFYPLPARPPLVNVVEETLASLGVADFPHLQLVGTVLSSLVFLPLAVLAGRWGAGFSSVILAVLLLSNPAFAEGATFFWTKLPTAFFVLTCLYFFLFGTISGPPNPAAILLCGLAMAAGILGHYSAVPYAAVIVVAWAVVAGRRSDPQFWRWSLGAAALVAAFLLLWFGWSIAVYGSRVTFLQNSTVMNPNPREGGRAVMMALNLRDTTVPAFLRNFDKSLIDQASRRGYVRDYMFNLYQENLLFGLGSLGWILVLREAWRSRSRPGAWFWVLAILATIVIGVGVSGDRGEWGAAQLCLQPLLLVGLAFLAARWGTMTTGWRLVLAVGCLIDLGLGVALQFLTENFAIDRWTHAHFWTDIIAAYNWGTAFNLRAKVLGHIPFVGDVAGIPAGLILIFLGLVLAAAVARVGRLRPPPADGSDAPAT